MQGTVKRVFQDKGYGFIRGEDGVERFFHRDNCASDFTDLREGQTVSFDSTQGERGKGPRADDVRLHQFGQ